MKVVDTWMWTYLQFKDIPLLIKIIREEIQYEDDTNFDNYWGDPPPITMNDSPFFNWLKIHKVQDEDGYSYYFERPFATTVRGRSGGTTYHHCIRKIHESYIPALMAML